MRGRTVRTYARGERLLAKLARGYSIAAACKSERIGRRTFYDWKDSDEAFAAKVADAIEDGTDVLEDVARNRAMKTSDTLMSLLLKARRPDVYRERNETKHVGPDGGEVLVKVIRDHPPAEQR